MNRFFTLLLAASCLTAVGQVPDYVPTDGLVAWYHLDGNALDEGLLGNHLQIQGATSSTDRFMNELGAFYFDGGATLQASSFTGIGENSSHTISFWETHSSIHDGCILSETGGGSTGNKLHYCLRGPEDGVCIDGGCMGLDFYSSQHFTSFTAELDNWNHWVLTYESGSQNSQIFLNGDMVSEQPMPTPWTGTFDDGICIGAFCQSSGDQSYFIGSIDDFGIWDRPLSPLEIEGLYESTNVVGCTDMTACNYNPEANLENDSCHFNCQFCLTGTVWSEALGGCIGDGSGDINLDGCVQLNDLLDLLSAYGDCGAEESPWLCGVPLEYQGYDYETVQIGEQCWFAENLRAENYLNGDVIPMVTENEEWLGTMQGARCWHDNDSTSWDFPGFLYNGYAVEDSRLLCPQSWHVGTDLDWAEVEIGHGLEQDEAYEDGQRGGNINLSQKMRDQSWGLDVLGFGVLPGGYRSWQNGNFSGEIQSGAFWSNGSEWHGYREFHGPWVGVARGEIGISEGLSVRCIKDTE